MLDLCSIKGFDRLEFYVGNAKQAAFYYSKCFGFINTAYRGLETGSRETSSYLMEQGDIRLVLSAGLSPIHPIARSAFKHGDSIAIIALEVEDAVSAYTEAIERGAIGAIEPTEKEDENGIVIYSAIHAYGDVLLEFVDRSNYRGFFAPGFQRRYESDNNVAGVGLKSIDHVVGNVEMGKMDRWAQFFAEAIGLSLSVNFDEKTISTRYSALKSKVMQDPRGKIKLPINEPAPSKGKSQIQEYLEYNRGAGIQHVAFATDNIIQTVSQLKAAGVEFIDTPKTYYDRLPETLSRIDLPIDKLAELGILVDRDRDGYLLQIFTKPVQDRPTLFFEIIERHGAQGFGQGNFKALFEAIEREQALRGNL